MKKLTQTSVFIALSAILLSCTGGTKLPQKSGQLGLPDSYLTEADTINSALLSWKEFFKDPFLVSLIDSAVAKNQEVNIMAQEIEIARNEIRAKKGEYLPFVNLTGGASGEKTPRYTRNGSTEANLPILENQAFPDPFGDFQLGVFAGWEIDIWKKLRNAKKAAVKRYLATIEGRNFLLTQLVAEIADQYYELLALDNQRIILEQNIAIQEQALEIVRLQKQASQVTELAVKRFEAQLLNTKSLKYQLRQRITEAENQLNTIVGRVPHKLERSQLDLQKVYPQEIETGLPAQLLSLRPDVRSAQLKLQAAKLDVKIAKARFYPSLALKAGLGFQAFNPTYLLRSPESLLYNMAGDLIAPLINRNAIKADYYNANAAQIAAIYQYEQTVLNAYVEVINQLSKLENVQQSFQLKEAEVKALQESVEISNKLFRSARADYMEILLTQREFLSSKFELIELKKDQLISSINLYKALGGGWR